MGRHECELREVGVKRKVESSHRITRKRRPLVWPLGNQPRLCKLVVEGGERSIPECHGGRRKCKDPRWHSIPKGGWDILFPGPGRSLRKAVGWKSTLAVWELSLKKQLSSPWPAQCKELPQGPRVRKPRGQWNKTDHALVMHWMSSVKAVSTCHNHRTIPSKVKNVLGDSLWKSITNSYAFKTFSGFTTLCFKGSQLKWEG